MGLDCLVDFAHEADGFVEGDDDAVVVADVFVGEDAAGAGVLAALALAVAEPLLADLVAADVKVPDGFGHAVEADLWKDGIPRYSLQPDAPSSLWYSSIRGIDGRDVFRIQRVRVVH